MEHYILQRKIINLVKNKESDFRIPTAFNPQTAEVILEVESNQFQEDLVVELLLKKTIALENATSFIVQIPLDKTITRFSFKNVEDIGSKDILLFACRANYSFQVALSLRSL